MIPKPLNEIEWSDIEALRDSGREEDDTIEFKASFTGGSDYLEFNDAKRAKAIEGIAREAVAFLNGRGGDIVIGVRESANEHPKIEEITSVQNIDQTVDRLAQSLTALIEPAQTVLALRAIRFAEGASEGVIIVRCPLSLRAPHRFTPTKNCYVRRGRSSVPMPMDEIQDMSIRRANLRKDRREELERLTRSIGLNLSGRTNLPDNRFHVRSVFIPYQDQQIEIDDDLCYILKGSDPVLVRSGKKEQITMPFRDLGFQFSPILRGRRSEKIANGFPQDADFSFCSKDIRKSGIITADFACRVSLDSTEGSKFGLYHGWIAGYVANTLLSFQKVAECRPGLSEGFLSVAFHVCGQTVSRVGDGMWQSDYEWPQGMIELPIFEIGSPADFARVIDQVQTDACSIIGIADRSNWALVG